MESIMVQQQKWLLRKFHTLCSKAGMTQDEKAALISSYGHISSADMEDSQLQDACIKLQLSTNPKLAEMDTWRKRVFAAIGSYLRFAGKTETPEFIKAIACRSTGFDRFNEIPVERLRNVYYAFTKKHKDFERSWKEMEKILEDGTY